MATHGHIKTCCCLCALPAAGVLPGQVMLQNLPSVVAGVVLSPPPGSRVLDMCAAPGGGQPTATPVLTHSTRGSTAAHVLPVPVKRLGGAAASSSIQWVYCMAALWLWWEVGWGVLQATTHPVPACLLTTCSQPACCGGPVVLHRQDHPAGPADVQSGGGSGPGSLTCQGAALQ
jgi:hypothetical protein